MNDIDSLKFQIEKTQQSLFEAGRRLSSTIKYVLAFLSFSAIITFGLIADSEITIPIFNIKLQQWHAAEASIVITSLAIYRLYYQNMFLRLLWLRLTRLLEEAKWERSTWALQYPGIHMALNTTASLSKLSAIMAGMYASVILALTCVAPVVILVRIGYRDSFSGFWITSACICALFLIAAGITLSYTYGHKEIDATLEKMKDH